MGSRPLPDLGAFLLDLAGNLLRGPILATATDAALDAECQARGEADEEGQAEDHSQSEDQGEALL